MGSNPTLSEILNGGNTNPVIDSNSIDFIGLCLFLINKKKMKICNERKM